MKKWMFVFAHLDDETILSYGLIKKVLEQGDDAFIYVFCGCGRQTQDALQQERIAAFKSLWRDQTNLAFELGTWHDLTLSQNEVNLKFCKLVHEMKPEAVVTHSLSDLHFEHRMLAEASLIACRKSQDCSVAQLLHAQAMFSDAWSYGKLGIFKPDTFVDISQHMDGKLNALQKYVPELPASQCDCRSPESIILSNAMQGRQMGRRCCEAYETVFRLL